MLFISLPHSLHVSWSRSYHGPSHSVTHAKKFKAGQADVTMTKISVHFKIIFEDNMDKHKVKMTCFFRLINKGRERHGRGDIHWL